MSTTVTKTPKKKAAKKEGAGSTKPRVKSASAPKRKSTTATKGGKANSGRKAAVAKAGSKKPSARTSSAKTRPAKSTVAGAVKVPRVKKVKETTEAAPTAESQITIALPPERKFKWSEFKKYAPKQAGVRAQPYRRMFDDALDKAKENYPIEERFDVRLSPDTVRLARFLAEEHLTTLANEACKLARHVGRKTVISGDLIAASEIHEFHNPNQLKSGLVAPLKQKKKKAIARVAGVAGAAVGAVVDPVAAPATGIVAAVGGAAPVDGAAPKARGGRGGNKKKKAADAAVAPTTSADQSSVHVPTLAVVEPMAA